MDRYLILAAYAMVAQRWHSGQWSVGYRKLSRCATLGLRMGHGAYRRGSDERREAARLLWKRRREVARHW